MKLVHSPHKLLPHLCHHQNFRVLASHLHTDKTLIPDKPESLFRRIRLVKDPKASIVPVLDQWVEEGRHINKLELHALVRIMKCYRRFIHALEISQWMSDRRYYIFSSNDAAIRLDLISRVYGPDHAERYFNSISNNLKNSVVYGAVLGSYVRNKCVEKAEAVMQKMREMQLVRSSVAYNMLISLYSQTNEHEKIEILLQEMEKNQIPQDIFTMRNRMSAYVAASDISGMEKCLIRIEEDPQLNVDWNIYSVAASGYLKAGSTEKALTMLKKLEENIPLAGSKFALEYLLTLTATAGSKDELYRVWNTYKPLKNVDTSYACMITSLSKLDDIEGAEKIFHEWESQCTMYDFRVLNRLLVAYCKKGFIDKAVSLVEKAVQGRTPVASSWNILAIGYSENKQIPKAVEMLKKAMYTGRNGWRPNSNILAPCLDYLGEQGDIKEMEEIIRLYKILSPLTRGIYHKLLCAYVAAGKSVSSVLDRMKMDGFAADEETEKILESCTKSYSLQKFDADVSSEDLQGTRTLKLQRAIEKITF